MLQQCWTILWTIMNNMGSKTLFNRAVWGLNFRLCFVDYLGACPQENCQIGKLSKPGPRKCDLRIEYIFSYSFGNLPGFSILTARERLAQKQKISSAAKAGRGGIVTPHLCGYWYYRSCIAHALWVVNITGPTVVSVYHTHLFLIVRETHSQLEWTRVLLQYMCRAIVARLSSDVCLCLNSKRSRSQTLSELQICPQNYEKTNTVLNSLAVLRYYLILEYFLIISQIRRKRVIQCMLAWIFVQRTSRIFEDFENILRVKGLSHKEIMALAVMVSLWIDTFSFIVDKTCANIQTRLGY